MKLAKQIIQKSKQANAWSLGNQVLYDLCRKYFKHINEKAIIGKIWLIGRAYAAAIERRKQKKEINDDFYINAVVPRIMHSKLDERLAELKHHNEITNDNLTLVLQTHHYLMTIFHKLTGLEKRSLAAKYLHFHLPNLFYIYDSRAASAVNKLAPKLKPIDIGKIKRKHVDEIYETFVLKCQILRAEIKESYKMEISPRELDNLLILKANHENRNK